MRSMRVCGVLGTVVVMCSCGNPDPLIVPLMPGSGAFATCGACDTKWMIKSITYTEPPRSLNGEPPTERANIDVQFHAIVPRIQRPHLIV